MINKSDKYELNIYVFYLKKRFLSIGVYLQVTCAFLCTSGKHVGIILIKHFET